MRAGSYPCFICLTPLLVTKPCLQPSHLGASRGHQAPETSWREQGSSGPSNILERAGAIRPQKHLGGSRGPQVPVTAWSEQGPSGHRNSLEGAEAIGPQKHLGGSRG